MLGAIVGDVIGSVYERHPIKTTAFPLFQPHSRYTDDTVLTVAVAHAILEGEPYSDALRRYGRAYPHAGYGGGFKAWLAAPEPRPYESFGNGAAMRVSPVGFAFDDVDTILAEARRTAEPSHDHPEGIKGAQATALAVYLARTARDKEVIRREIVDRFGYDLDRTVDGIRPGYAFDVTCQGTVPEAIIAFLDSHDYEHAVRLAVSLGGDSDTLAAITGGIAQAYYGGVPDDIAGEVRSRLPAAFLDVIDRFSAAYGAP